MGFLIRTAFWFSLVLLVIPFHGSESGEPTVGPVETFFAAREVIGDMAGLCEREPEACEVGRSALHTISVRARETARFAYGMLEDKPATSETAATEFTRASLDETSVGTVPATAPIPTPSPAAAQIATQND